MGKMLFVVVVGLICSEQVFSAVPADCSQEDIYAGGLECHSNTLSFLTKCTGPCGSGGVLNGWYETCTDKGTGETCKKFIQCTPDCHNGSYSDSLKACFCRPGFRGECCEKEVPCSDTKVITNNGDRSIHYKSNVASYRHCDWFLPVDWYRFTSPAGDRLPESPVAPGQCNTLIPLYLNGAHPSMSEGTVVREVCGAGDKNPCLYRFNIEVRNCGDFMSYHLQPSFICPMAYCLTNATEPDVTTTSEATREPPSPSSSPVTEVPTQEPETEPTGTQTKGTITPTQPETQAPTESTSVKPVTAATTESHGTTTPLDFVCPTPNGLFNHPTDPKKFVQCSNSIPYVFDCPDNTIFDQQRERCVWPWEVNQTSSRPEPSSEATASNSESSTTSEDLTSSGTEAPLDFICPTPDGLYNHPTDPHKFINCANGIPYVFKCAGNTVFDKNAERCVWPWEVNQTSSNPQPSSEGPASSASTAADLTTEDIETTTSSHISAGSTSGKTATPSGIDGFKCPESNGYYNHPTDPHKFIQCGNNVPYEKECPRGTVFDETLKVCVFPKH